ncbi:MAG: GIY-YIG nuclease family protein [Enterococcus sp.]
MKSIQEQLQNLPQAPGIYLMKDQHQAILYVGKAKNLKQRVRSYFQKSANHAQKIRRLIRNVATIETIVVDTELDALLLECEFIQRYHPLYNRQLTQHPNYLYVGLDDLTLTLSPRAQPNFWGPFKQYKQLPEILTCLTETLELPNLAPITQLKLRQQLTTPTLTNAEKKAAITNFFTGQPSRLFDQLSSRITYCSEHLDFEQAQRLTTEYNRAQRLHQMIASLNQFQARAHCQLALPINEQLTKHYLICYGQIKATQISAAQHIDFPALTATPIEITKASLDPLILLMNYYNNFT